MQVTTTAGRERTLQPDALAALQARLRGPVLLPGEAGYEASRTVWNAMIAQRPALVVRCLGAADAIACVQFAREHDIFGVVTGIEYALHPLGPEIVGGLVAWPASDSPQVLELYRTLAESAPRELTLVAIMRPALPAPWLPAAMHGKPIIALLACYSGPPEQAEQAVAHAADIRSPHSAVILFQIDGALNELDAAHSPAGNRDARYVLNVTAAWEQPGEDDANIAWARAAWHEMKAFSTGGTYLNFLTRDEGPERTHAALGASVHRLAEVKAAWDPHNVFRTNRNIVPA